jgi:hypothetical protein
MCRSSRLSGREIDRMNVLEGGREGIRILSAKGDSLGH